MGAASRLKQLLRRVGIEARRYGVQTSADAQLGRILAHLGVDLVVDVGAHEGEYALGLRALGYTAGVVSFEPQRVAHARLLRNSCGDASWIAAPRMALGDTEGMVSLHISGHSLSSSILRMLPLHEEALPASRCTGVEQVPIARLDHVLVPHLASARTVMLKIDTQGYEDRVIDGAIGVLERVAAIQIELSLVPLYEGQVLFDQMRTLLKQHGFQLFALFPGYVDERTGQTLQVDGLFIRSGVSSYA